MDAIDRVTALMHRLRREWSECCILESAAFLDVQNQPMFIIIIILELKNTYRYNFYRYRYIFFIL